MFDVSEEMSFQKLLLVLSYNIVTTVELYSSSNTQNETVKKGGWAV